MDDGDAQHGAGGGAGASGLNPGSAGLYILMHNIDGPNFRSPHVQQAFSTLASAARIHLIATIDHINAPLLWDQELTQRFNWVWHDATTYEPYLSEVTYEAPVMGMSRDMAARGVGFVLRSLTPNHRHILKLLAQQQAGSSNSGVGFQEFNHLCQEQMLVNNATTLRHHMTELKDHALVQERRSSDGRDTIIIPEDKLAPIIAHLDADIKSANSKQVECAVAHSHC